MPITTWNAILDILPQVGVAVLAALASAWAVLKLFGTSWVKSVFDKDLEEFKRQQAQELETFKAERTVLLEQLRHAQSREMEGHKHRFQRMMDRASKLHQHEFEVLPEIWDRLSKAISATANLISKGQSYPRIGHMGVGELEELLEKLDILSWEKAELRQCPAAERDDRLITMLKWQRLRRTAELHEEFHNYLISRGIFLRAELRETIRELSDLNYDAFSEHRLDLETGGKVPFKKRARFNKEWFKRMNSIQAMVVNRLWDNGALGEDSTGA